MPRVRKRKPKVEGEGTIYGKSTPQNTVLYKNLDIKLREQWPKENKKVPPIFLHKPVDFKDHVAELLQMNIEFFRPLLCRNYTKITVPTLKNHENLAQYFINKRLPFHTFAYYYKRVMKVVISGLPQDVDLMTVKKELIDLGIPVMKIHTMKNRPNRNRPFLALVVIPKKKSEAMFRVAKILDYDVKLEPPKSKVQQCHNCQRWGHAQRNCHGVSKCVKCAGDHYTSLCTVHKSVPPKCANCNGIHTANYRKCPSCPLSEAYKVIMNKNKRWSRPKCMIEVVTPENIHCLYRNVIQSDVDVITGQMNRLAPT